MWSASVGEGTLDVRVVNVFTVRDGRVARLDTFFGDQPAVERFWTSVPGGEFGLPSFRQGVHTGKSYRAGPDAGDPIYPWPQPCAATTSPPSGAR